MECAWPPRKEEEKHQLVQLVARKLVQCPPVWGRWFCATTISFRIQLVAKATAPTMNGAKLSEEEETTAASGQGRVLSPGHQELGALGRPL